MNDAGTDDLSSARYGIETVDLVKRFPPTQILRRKSSADQGKLAVDGVSLQVEVGGIFGLIGPNGAGKTTLISMLTTLLLPSSGTASVLGLDVVRHEARIRRLVGLVTSNERSFYWRLTGRQNLRFFASLYRLTGRRARIWVDELLDMVDLTEAADTRFNVYSTGMRQRLAVARGLLNRPRVLFMDEPTKGVDPIGRKQLMTLICERILDFGKPTILVTSHDLAEIERLCSRIALFHRGQIAAIGTVGELRAMAHAFDRFDLRISKLEASRIESIASATTPRDQITIVADNGTCDLTVEYPKSQSGLRHLIRGVVEAGGDVVNCTSAEVSFEDVFHRLVGEAWIDAQEPQVGTEAR